MSGNGEYNPSSNHPKLRQPSLTPQQVMAAVELGFTDKHVNNEFPEIGTFTIPSEGQGQEQEEGTLPPLRRPNVNQVPPDVLGVILKHTRFEQFLGMENQNQEEQYQNQNQNQNQTSIRSGSGQGQRRGDDQNQSQKFKLSPTAKEFYPNQSQGHQYYEDDSQDALAQAVAQFQLQNQGQGQEQGLDYGGGDFDSLGAPSFVEDNTDRVLSTVTDTINELAGNPASFSRCAKDLTDVLKQDCNDADVFGVVVTLLLEQSIVNPNFCYSGARLVDTLTKNGVAVCGKTLKVAVLHRCREEMVYCQEHMANNPQLTARCRGLLHFLGELFTNLRSSSGEPISILGIAVLEVMQNLLKDPPYENVRVVFQVMKLVGFEFDKSVDEKIKTEYEKVLKDMSYLCLASNIEPRSKGLLDAFFDLKNKNWNKDPYPEPSSSPHLSTSSNASDPTHVYELPESYDEDVGDDDDYIALDDEPEEVRLAYEEFLKSAQQ